MSEMSEEPQEPRAVPVGRDPKYLRMMLALLVSVSFFEGFDGSILSLLLPDVQATFRASEALLGVIRIPIEFGVVVAFGLTNLADRIGRRRLLLISVIGYTIFTALTALSWNIWSFATFQFASRIFLGSEYAVALTMIAEEYPAETRGRALGKLTTFDALGVILVAVLLGVGLDATSVGWRAFFLVGLVPLLVLGFLRRRLRETARYEQLVVRRAAGLEPPRQSLLDVWRPGMRRDLALIGVIHLLRSVPLAATTAWWAYFAERERGYSSLHVALTILVAYGFGCVGYYVCGRLMDSIGRRRTALIFMVGSIGFAIIEFQTTNAVVAFVVLSFAVAFGLGSRPVLSGWVAELFPTQVRSQAASYVRNVFEVGGAIVGPALTGILGDHRSGAIGNIGDTVSLLVLLQIPATYLIWRHLPETKGLDLDAVDRAGIGHLGPRPTRAAASKVIGLAISALLLVGFVVSQLGGHNRPEGAVERWLVAVSEQGRPGLRADAQRRAAGLGTVAAADALRPVPVPKDANWFSSIEVGKAQDGAVPFAVFRVTGNERTDRLRGIIRLREVDGRPFVAGVEIVGPVAEGSRVPSHGGTPPAKAPLTLWIVSVLLMLALGPLLGTLIGRMKHTERPPT